MTRGWISWSGTEAFAYGERRGVDLSLLRQILDAGPMASTVSRGRLAKLLGR
ncbi:hypothetical protein MLP_45480 [Microlunatus phosphovorus NM-1]|uniref:Uncharacterized protein n=1 Tax=Microlunatus phosphovorus (strain ATCC 700054 / DSM 10555 / JCM 9379 / NBRC 101784 / NCIMB 13414 / VKM Ac-1990 / NM-1) TaxID=1032480 RepID=F5XTW3_MICPN|nr:hypothetical protein MLP_45480 [Microlunatus phosphovorus NM-1]